MANILPLTSCMEGEFSSLLRLKSALEGVAALGDSWLIL